MSRHGFPRLWGWEWNSAKARPKAAFLPAKPGGDDRPRASA